MNTTASQHFRVDPWELRRLGAYDVPVDGPEAPVYLDPRLLRRSRVPEFATAMDQVGQRFASVFLDIRLAKETQGAAAEALRERSKQKLRFAELEGLRIGVGQGKGHGRGIGKERASKLHKLAEQFVRDEFTDPVLFEMFTLVETGVGADLVSDMLADIAQDSLCRFSERVARELNIPTREFVTAERSYALPWNGLRNEFILFPPEDALADIPGFRTSKRFDKFQFSNEQIRKAISDWIKKHGSTDAARRFLLEHRALTAEIKNAYTTTKPRAPDPFSGKEGARLAGLEIAQDLKPELARVRSPTTAQELEAAVRDAVTRFKAYVDAGRARTQLHGKYERDEKFVQHMFATFVETFCQDRAIRCSREVDDGMGPVDFLFTIGNRITVALELKLSSNTALVRTYETQVQAYAAASVAQGMFFVVIDLSEERKRLEQIVKRHDVLKGNPRRPRLFIVDGRNSPPASKIQEQREPLPQPDQPKLVAQPSPEPHRATTSRRNVVRVPMQTARAAPKAAAPIRPKSGWEILAEALETVTRRVEEQNKRRSPPR